LITELAGLKQQRQVSSSRFGNVQLVRRLRETGSGWEEFAAKFYNAGDNKPGRTGFMKQMLPVLRLDHPGVMRIRGLIAPSPGKGPIILTEFSEYGSLEDVLNRVRESHPPPFWSHATITKIIFSLVTGFEYLHSQGIVHGELKPSDVIVQADGTARICDYMTSYLEERRFTKASQFRPLFHMAPEQYGNDDDDQDGELRDPKTDVFAFGLIAFELVSLARVFPPSMALGKIMRTAKSGQAADRPKISDSVPGVLADLIRRCWVPEPSMRPPFAEILRQLNGITFHVFPDGDRRLTMLPSESLPESRAGVCNTKAESEADSVNEAGSVTESTFDDIQGKPSGARRLGRDASPPAGSDVKSESSAGPASPPDHRRPGASGSPSRVRRRCGRLASRK
jgi:serine/threonine protein kinase